MDSEETAIEGNPVEGEGQRGQGSLFWQSSSSSLSDGFEVPEFLACPKDDSSTIPTATESFMVIGDTVLDGSDDEDSAAEASMIKEDATFDGSFSLLESLDQDDDASVQSEVEQFTGHLSKQLIDVGSREIVGSESREIIGSGTKGIIGSVVNLEESLIDGSSSGDTEELIVGSDELVDTVSSHQSLDPLSVFAIEQESSKKLITPENIHTNSNIPDEISLTPKLFQPQEPQIRSKKRPQTTVSNIPKEVFKTAATSKQRIFKVIIVGDTNVGKTCLAVRFCSGSFPEKVEATIGVDFREKSIEIAGDTIKLQLWDTAGQERFRKSMVPHYYRNANAIVFVYDVTKQSSFGSLPSWIQECDEYNLGKDVPRILIGNKCDLYDQIVVGTSLAQQFADLHHMPLFETSAKTNSDSDNVESIFLTLAYKLKCCRPWMQVPRNCGYMYSSRSTVFLSLDAPNRQENDANFCVCFK